MTTLDHRLPHTGVARETRAQGALAVLLGKVLANGYLRLFSALVVIAAGAVLFVFGIVLVFDFVVPLIFGNELHALAALFSHR